MKLLRRTLYVRLAENELFVRWLEQGKEIALTPWIAVEQKKKTQVIKAFGTDALAYRDKPGFSISNPFSHPRMLISDFLVAQKMLQFAVFSLLQGSMLNLKPRILMHQAERTEAGLTGIEKRALQELALGVGAEEVTIWEGENPTDEQVVSAFKTLRADRICIRKPPRYGLRFVSLVLVIGLAAGAWWVWQKTGGLDPKKAMALINQVLQA